MRELGKTKSLAFRQSLVGGTIEVLVLGPKAERPATGLSGNYVKAYFRNPLTRGSLITARVIAIEADGVLAVHERACE